MQLISLSCAATPAEDINDFLLDWPSCEASHIHTCVTIQSLNCDSLAFKKIAQSTANVTLMCLSADALTASLLFSFCPIARAVTADMCALMLARHSVVMLDLELTILLELGICFKQNHISSSIYEGSLSLP